MTNAVLVDIPMPADPSHELYGRQLVGVSRCRPPETREQYRQRVDGYLDLLLLSWTHAILCAVWRLPTDDTATTPLLWAQRQYLLHQLREAA